MGRERLPCSPRFAPQPAHGEWSLHTGLYWAWAATALSEETASQGSDLSDLAIRGILAIGVIVFVTGISACDCLWCKRQKTFTPMHRIFVGHASSLPVDRQSRRVGIALVEVLRYAEKTRPLLEVKFRFRSVLYSGWLLIRKS
jgi:hypothetical protein